MWLYDLLMVEPHGGSNPSSDGPAVILATVDGSPTASRAVAWAGGMARRQHARLVCLYIASHYSGLARFAVASSGADVPLDLDKDELAKEIFADLRVQTNRHNIDAEFVIRSGDPASEIQQFVDELKPDMVVVGASMKAGHRLVGSVAIRLVKSAGCPVTVVP